MRSRDNQASLIVEADAEEAAERSALGAESPVSERVNVAGRVTDPDSSSLDGVPVSMESDETSSKDTVTRQLSSGQSSPTLAEQTLESGSLQVLNNGTSLAREAITPPEATSAPTARKMRPRHDYEDRLEVREGVTLTKETTNGTKHEGHVRWVVLKAAEDPEVDKSERPGLLKRTWRRFKEGYPEIEEETLVTLVCRDKWPSVEHAQDWLHVEFALMELTIYDLKQTLRALEQVLPIEFVLDPDLAGWELDPQEIPIRSHGSGMTIREMFERLFGPRGLGFDALDEETILVHRQQATSVDEGVFIGKDGKVTRRDVPGGVGGTVPSGNTPSDSHRMDLSGEPA